MMSDTIYEPNDRSAADRDDKFLVGLNYVLFLLGNIIGVTSLVAVVIAYARRDHAPHWLQSHYTYQVKSFWGAFVGLVACTLLVVTVVLSPFGLLGFLLIWAWMAIRSVMGLIRLVDGRGHPDPHGFWV
jgi:uncharacterized membrane protein